jgi:hypothetical protein
LRWNTHPHAVQIAAGDAGIEVLCHLPWSQPTRKPPVELVTQCCGIAIQRPEAAGATEPRASRRPRIAAGSRPSCRRPPALPLATASLNVWPGRDMTIRRRRGRGHVVGIGYQVVCARNWVAA